MSFSELLSAQPKSKGSMTRQQMQNTIMEKLMGLLDGEYGGMSDNVKGQMYKSNANQIDFELEDMAREISANAASAGGTFSGATVGALNDNQRKGAFAKSALKGNLDVEQERMKNASFLTGLQGLQNQFATVQSSHDARKGMQQQSKQAAIGSMGQLAAVAAMIGTGGAATPAVAPMLAGQSAGAGAGASMGSGGIIPPWLFGGK